MQGKSNGTKDTEEDFSPVDVNLVKSFLDSFSSQSCFQFAWFMGVQLPRYDKKGK
jgi:hypothetical protein